MARELLGYHLTRFIRDYLVAERGLSEGTVDSYRDCFRLLLRYMRDSRDVSPERARVTDVVSKEAVLGFLDWLESDRGCSPRTRNQRLAAIKSFCRHLSLDAPELLGPCTEVLSIRAKREPAREIGFLTADEVRGLLSEPDPSTPIGRRDCVMLSVLYDTGARVQELCDVRVRDVRLGKSPQVTLHGKGSKVRTVPLMAPTAELLGGWMRDGRPKADWGLAPADEHLFHSSRSEHMTRWCVEKLLDAYVGAIRGRDPDFAKGLRVTPHVLRHSKASHLLQADVNLVYIRDLLGHSSVRTTEIYARADVEHKRRHVEAAYESPAPSDLPDWTEDTALMEWLSGLH